VALLLEDAGYEVERKFNLGGTVVAHSALVSGEIDLYVEYTGTALVAILGLEVPPAQEGGQGTPVVSIPQQVYDIVAGVYLDEFGAVWLEPFGFNNTYTMTVTQETAEQFGLQTISDLEGVVADMVVGGTRAFMIREDGMPGLEEAYGFEFADGVGRDPGLVFLAVESGEVDIVSANSTDGRIQATGLVMLEDDLGFFPPYYLGPVVNQELLEQYPELEGVLNQLAGKIDEVTMAQMNFRVDEGGEQPIDVARDFLVDQGIIDPEE
jgi:glycine betaine/choline ABC-type transport system substrate-binding protein